MFRYINLCLIFISISCGKSAPNNERVENSDSNPEANQPLNAVDSELNEQSFFAENGSGFIVHLLFKDNKAYLSKAHGNPDIFTYSLNVKNGEGDYDLVFKNKDNQTVTTGIVSATKETISFKVDNEKFLFFKRAPNTITTKQVLVSENGHNILTFHSNHRVTIELEDGTKEDYDYYISAILKDAMPYRQNIEGFLTDKKGKIIADVTRFRHVYGLDIFFKKDDKDKFYVFYSPEELQIIKNK